MQFANRKMHLSASHITGAYILTEVLTETGRHCKKVFAIIYVK
jgi:hypothetical protein